MKKLMKFTHVKVEMAYKFLVVPMMNNVVKLKSAAQNVKIIIVP